MRNSTMRDSVIFGSAFALTVTGIAVIVIGTWAIAPEGSDPRNEPAIANTASSPKASAGSELYYYPSNIVNLPAFSSDGQQVGEVLKVSVNPDGEVSYLYVEMPEFLGLGTRIVRIPAGMFDRKENRVDLAVTADAAKALPAVE